jgi:hypothetical protein
MSNYFDKMCHVQMLHMQHLHVMNYRTPARIRICVQIKAVSELSDVRVERTYVQMMQYEVAINELNDTSTENQSPNEVIEY